MSTDSDCEHQLGFRDRVLLSKGKGRTCPKCGAHVFVKLPVFSAILTHLYLVVAVLFAIAWVDGGAGWFWFGLVLGAITFVYVVEVKHRPLEAFDYAEYQEKAKRVRIQLVFAAILSAALIYLFFFG